MKHSLPFFNYSVRNESNDTVDIYIDGHIVDAPTQELMREWFGDETSVSYKSIRDQITSTKPKTVNVYVNSPGGMVSDAMAIHDMIIDLQNKGVKVNTFGRGIIASAATYILMAGNSDISENSWFMIHNVQGGAYGDVNDVEQAAKILRKFNNQVRDLYANYTGKPAETITAWMNKETWFNGKEAVENGFVKNVSSQVSFTNSIEPEKWLFHNTAVLNAYNSSVKNENMKFDFEGLKNAVKAVLIENGLIKKEDDSQAENIAEKLAVTVQNQVQPVIDSIPEVVKNEVATLLKQTGEGTISEAFTNAVKEATKDTATAQTVTDLQNKVTELENNIAKKLGGQAIEQEDKKDKKKNFFQVGQFD